jgi:ABC-type cobalamin/Fe3+-siderophores transport system ATPase subunit
VKLISVQIFKYKNILDSTPVEIQPDITCLVGKNESGKTAYLNALYRLNPARPNAVFNLQREYPAWLEKRHRMEGKSLADVTPVVAEFILEPDDITKLDAQFGTGVLKSSRLRVSRNYDNKLNIDFESDEAAAVKNVISKVDLGHEATQDLVSVTTFADLTRAMEDFKARTGDENEPFRAATAALERIKTETLKNSATLDGALSEALNPLIPKFFYFDDYANLPGIVKIRELLEANPATLNDDQLTARSLLKAAGADKDYLLNPDYETRKRELENVANAITEEVLKYWSTNPELRVDIDISQRAVPAPNPPGGQTTVLDELRVRLYDNRHLLSLPFDERSTGFRWFFSFLAAFSNYLYSNEPVILLLDEPGLGLHARAQKDFLRFIDERLGKRCQVIYSAHSPFMVQPGKLERVRLVEDRARENGSMVSANVLATDPDTLFPLQGALGYDLAQHLFIGQANLVIEGTSDYTYLTILSNWLREHGRTALDERWTLVPVGGADMVPTFVALLGSHLDITVLVDARRSGHQRLSNLAQQGYLIDTRIITIGEILGRPAADIEDLFRTEDYLAIYNAAFNKAHAPVNLPGSDPIVSRIARAEGIERFDHGKPADLLLRRRDQLLPKLSEKTIASFEELFKRVNLTLSSK